MIKLNLDFENEKELDESKFFGEILLPEKWFENDVFSPDEMFVCQINLSEISYAGFASVLPSSGMLFFFIDTKKFPYKSVIRYFDGELDAYTCFNDDIDSHINVIDEIGVSFEKASSGDIGMLTDDKAEGFDTCLLRIRQDREDLLLPINGDLYFFVNKQDVLQKDFSKSELIIKKW
ncbi:MAG: hypothetical protein ACI4M6_05115 [Christensenellaceae bacterium]